ncbi:MAG: hypothetical protein ACRDO1_06350 [Nocardioidaceae bacterium]
MTDRLPPKRVRVTSPRTSATRPRRVTVAREIDDQTGVGEVYMRSLMSSQLRLALLVLGAMTLLLGGLPALFALVPQVREVVVLGLPLPWLLLGGLVYPVLIALGWIFVRHAERTEREFADLVDRP